MNQIARLDSPLGTILLRLGAGAITGLYFDDQRHRPADLDSLPRNDSHPLAKRAAVHIGRYFAGHPLPGDLPLSLTGTAFQRRVWTALQGIPHGATTSYGELARVIGSPSAVRAVGAAVGRNPVSILVPCHRVLGSAGALTGYAGGLARKTQLLTLEGAWPRGSRESH